MWPLWRKRAQRGRIPRRETETEPQIPSAQALACEARLARNLGAVVRVQVLRRVPARAHFARFLRSAKGAAARHHARKKLVSPSGGALDTVPVLRDS
jgi:hypothetical protein